MTTTLFYVFVVVVILQLAYFILFSKFSFVKPFITEPNDQGVSVIIAAKNEAEHLKINLPKILNQQFDPFEVILVNDASTDASAEILAKFQTEYPHLKVISLAKTSQYSGRKKNAVNKAISHARYPILLFTDADCQPVSKDWITIMTTGFINGKNIVLGYGGYQMIKGSFLNKLIRYETLLTAIQYFSYALHQLPYMGVGRNLAYQKSLFEESGFSKHQDLMSGDDDLFVNEHANAHNTSIVVSKESFTISTPKTNWSAWFKQKRRHISTAGHYKLIHKILLSIFYFSQFLFWLLTIILLSLAFNWQIVLALVLVRLMVQYLIYAKAAKKLNERDLILFFPILDFFVVTIQLMIFITNLITKPKNW